ncbi:MAG: DNA ligase [Deltaproteobacteria bacterium RIFOXYD12_FULL_50_9]|nr:MAG: DNA ligase [Deltaproteobacteria bacterium RIFOXYD12_FULL_50_9]
MSEKLDGIRGYWDGKQLFSKAGNAFHPPPAFTESFPDFAVEGEIWGGRRTFEKTRGIVKKKTPDEGWLELKFAIFDVPGAVGGFEERLKVAKAWFEKHPSRYAFVIEHSPVQDENRLKSELKRIEGLGGEGLILRRSGSPYTVGRSADIVKVKSYNDSEAVVIARIAGKGKNSGRLGSLLVELPETLVRFRIGTGFSDYIRANPPPVGAVITFKYYGLSEFGIPKFPSFLRVREID